MSQRQSGYERKAHDRYSTPPWVTRTLLHYLPPNASIWEPAAGNGAMVNVLRQAGYRVHATDLGRNFLTSEPNHCNAVVTNPPFKQSKEFIEHALAVTKPHDGFVAMLLRVDYDSASTRQHLFAHCRPFAGKIVLIKRIVWFTPAIAAPSYNHAWFLWDHRRCSPPELHYEPSGCIGRRPLP
jgi:hypothetical protein